MSVSPLQASSLSGRAQGGTCDVGGGFPLARLVWTVHRLEGQVRECQAIEADLCALQKWDQAERVADARVEIEAVCDNAAGTLFAVDVGREYGTVGASIYF